MLAVRIAVRAVAFTCLSGRDGDDVETAGKVCPGFMGSKPERCGFDQSLLFGEINGRCRIDHAVTMSEFYLHKAQGIIVHHDQIKLPLATSPVPVKRSQSLADEPAFCARFRCSAHKTSVLFHHLMQRPVRRDTGSVVQ